jgi:hypothetical protein
MNCPKCHKEIGFARQVKEMDENFYKDVEPPIILMLMCDTCEEPTVMISIDTVGELEEIDTPMGIAKFPVCSCDAGILPCVTHGWNPKM